MYTCETRFLECVADFNKVVGQKKGTKIKRINERRGGSGRTEPATWYLSFYVKVAQDLSSAR